MATRDPLSIDDSVLVQRPFRCVRDTFLHTYVSIESLPGGTEARAARRGAAELCTRL